MDAKSALIIIDIQNDFCQGGSLAVPGANSIISVINQLQANFSTIIATKDWHPPDHLSFASNHPGRKVNDIIMLSDGREQNLWPDHCVQHTEGAEFNSLLHTEKINKIILKGEDKKIDSYSAFFDNAHLKKTDLESYLQAKNINTLYLAGLATEYCVKYSALDARQLGFNVYVIQDACRGIELVEGDCIKAFQEMRDKGIDVIHSGDIIKQN